MTALCLLCPSIVFLYNTVFFHNIWGGGGGGSGKISWTHCLLENHLMIHIFGKVQGPTSTGDLHDEYLNIFECSHKPQNY